MPVAVEVFEDSCVLYRAYMMGPTRVICRKHVRLAEMLTVARVNDSS